MTSPPDGAAGTRLQIRVRGRVQGVGFRPTVWRYARDLGLAGEVLNDGEGVLIRVGGGAAALAAFIDRLQQAPPPLARIDRLEIEEFVGDLPEGFRIAETVAGGARTQVAPDAAICPACAAEITGGGRRHGYAFTTCTHCGPRLSIVRGIPYDRARTTMAGFPLCDACLAEYQDPADRRFHAEAIACPDCGPRLVLLPLDGGPVPEGDPIAAARALIRRGEIVAVKGLGGYQIACDATNADAVARLRRAKRRDAKPFALMARDLDAIRRYCTVGDEERRLLAGAPAPIVLLPADGPERLPAAVAPGLATLGFMLPTTPLHKLLLDGFEGPLVMTSGNVSDTPPVIDDAEFRRRLGGIAAFALTHDREIANRVDDSVARVMGGRPRLLRRARGYAPAPIPLPPGFEDAPDLLAMGGELKSTFCLVANGEAVLSQHLGDLENVATFAAYRDTLALFAVLFDHAPVGRVADAHPDYLSSKLARDLSRRDGLPLVEVQHHHAHVAACLAENGRPLDAPPVLGIVMDGLGWGDDGTFWGGEFLIADYRGYVRAAHLRPVAMPGGTQAVREPWRNLFAHLHAAIGWPEFAKRHAGLEIHADLTARPVAILERMVARGINAPAASSCGRLFDAVAAALGICRDRQSHEGEAATRLEAMADPAVLRAEGAGYPLSILRRSGPWLLDPAPMWRALLDDLARDTPAPVVAARFHRGLARALVTTAKALAGHQRFDTVALSGGCFQNRLLFEEVAAGLEAEGFAVLSHGEIPANDGGLALGQALIGAARGFTVTASGEPG